MIYVDSSVVLAYLLAESRAPSTEFLKLFLVSSRLLEYEVWTRLHSRQLDEIIENTARSLLSGIELIDMSRHALRRSLAPWPVSLRTLDALHLATAEYLRQGGEALVFASYDHRLVTAARALGFDIAAL